MFLKTSRNNSNVPSMADTLICGGEHASSDTLGARNVLSASSVSPNASSHAVNVAGSSQAHLDATNFVNIARAENQSEQQQQFIPQRVPPQQPQQRSGSESAENSNASLWRVPSRVTSPFEMPSAELHTTPAIAAAPTPTGTDATTATTTFTAPSAPAGQPGIVWIGYIMPSRVREVLSFLHSLKGIRFTSVTTEAGLPQPNLDFTFFLDGPYEGQGFLSFHSAKEAEDAVRLFSGAVVVGCQEPYMQLSLRLSSMAEVQAAKQQYRYNAHQSTPVTTPNHPPATTRSATFATTSAAAAATSAPAASAHGGSNNSSNVGGNLVYWLRGLPFQTQRSDVESFLKTIRYLRLDIGVLESGECSGNAFVELRGSECQEAIENLHNTFIPCAAHAAVPALDRPKPRFVEVILSNADRRLEQLSIDRSMIRNHLPHHPRVRVPATRTVSSSTNSAARYASQRVLSQQQHPQQQQQQRSFAQMQSFAGRDFSQTSAATAAAYAAPTAIATTQPATAPYFLVQSTPQVIGIVQSTTPIHSRLASPSHLFSPAEALTMLPSAQPQHQQQQQQQQRSSLVSTAPYNTLTGSNSHFYNTPPQQQQQQQGSPYGVNAMQTYAVAYEPMLPTTTTASASQSAVQANMAPPQQQPQQQSVPYGASYYAFPPRGHS